MAMRINNLVARISILGEFLSFLWRRKLWWMIPMIVVLAIFVVLLVFAQSSSLAPFIYTLF
jgi:drug/metabolite transporter superfamily protein YnfA